MKPKHNSAEDLHCRGQRTSLNLAVEMLRHLVCADQHNHAECRYCPADANLVDDARWLIKREDARAVALARATEIEQLVVRGEATKGDFAEYRALKASGHLDAGDEVQALLRAAVAQSGGST